MSESASTMCVCGEIGYALTTSGRQRATARATACEPSSCSRTDDAPFTDGVGGRERGGDVPLGRPAGKRPRIAFATDSTETTPVSAANPPSSAAFGSGLPRCSRASSVAATVTTRSGRKRLAAKSPRPSSSSAAAGVDQDVRLGPDAAEEVDLVQQRRVLHDQRVGLDDRLARADRPVGDAAERRHRRAGSLRPERRERERVLALGEGRDGEQLGRRDDSLPAATVDANLEHAVIVVPTPAGAHQRACGSRSVVLRASSRAERLR